MKSSAIEIGICLTVALIGVCLSGPARSEPNTKVNRAIVHIDRKEYDEAWKKLEEAKAEHPSLPLLAKVHRLEGRILAARQQWVDSVISFVRSLDIEPFPDPSRYSPEAQKLIACARTHHDARTEESLLRAMLEDARLDLPWICPREKKPPVAQEPPKKKGGMLELVGVPEGAEVFADAEKLAYKTGAWIPLGEGPHRVSIAAGERSWARDLTIRPGEKLTLEYVPPSSPPSPASWPLWAAGGLAVAAGGAGMFFGSAALSSARDLKNVTSDSTAYDRIASDAQNRAIMADISFGVAGLAIATGIGIYVWRAVHEEPNSPGALEIKPTAQSFELRANF